MGVRLVVGIWGQPIAKRTVAGTNAFNQPFFHQELQDAVHCHPINLLGSVQFLDNLLSTQGMRPVTNDFQNEQSIYLVA
jgi:hypothetical protein